MIEWKTNVFPRCCRTAQTSLSYSPKYVLVCTSTSLAIFSTRVPTRPPSPAIVESPKVGFEGAVDSAPERLFGTNEGILGLDEAEGDASLPKTACSITAPNTRSLSFLLVILANTASLRMCMDVHRCASLIIWVSGKRLGEATAKEQEAGVKGVYGVGGVGGADSVKQVNGVAGIENMDDVGEVAGVELVVQVPEL